MSFMVVDKYAPDFAGRPFGAFGPFATREEAEAFVARSSHPSGYWVFPSDWCS